MLGKLADTIGRVETFIERSNQRNPYKIGTRINAPDFTGQETAGQDHDIIVFEQTASELGVGNRCLGPQIKAGIRHAGA